MFKLSSLISKNPSNALYEKAYSLLKEVESATPNSDEYNKSMGEYKAFVDTAKASEAWNDEVYEAYCKKQEAKGATNYKTLLIGGGVVIAAAAVGAAAYFLLRHTDEVEVVGETVEVTDTDTNVE